MTFGEEMAGQGEEGGFSIKLVIKAWPCVSTVVERPWLAHQVVSSLAQTG